MNNCPKCGAVVNPGEAFCRNCGTKLTDTTTVVQNNVTDNASQPVITSNIPSSVEQIRNVDGQNNINDEELIDAYIGKNADKLKKGDFSVNTFFLGLFYVLYRKMWLLGIIWVVINMVSSVFLSYYASIISLAVSIYASIEFKKMYLKHVKEEVSKIKNNNPLLIAFSTFHLTCHSQLPCKVAIHIYYLSMPWASQRSLNSRIS